MRLTLAGMRTDEEGACLDQPELAATHLIADVLMTCRRYGVAPIGELEVFSMSSWDGGERCYRWRLRVDLSADQALR